MLEMAFDSSVYDRSPLSDWMSACRPSTVTLSVMLPIWSVKVPAANTSLAFTTIGVRSSV